MNKAIIMNGNRNDTISIAKAVGIFMMVLGHTHFSKYGNAWVSMIHMPLFFFFSGYCFKEKYVGHFLTFLKKRIRGIYWPALYWGILFLVLHNVFFNLSLYTEETSYLYSGREILKNAFFITTTMTHYEELLGGYWFMRTLFWCSLLGYLVIVINIKHLSLKVKLVILLIVSVLLLLVGVKVPYFDIGAREVIACSFFVAGYTYNKCKYKFEYSYWAVPLALVLVSFGAIYWQASLGWFQSMTWWKVIPWFFTALSGVIGIYAVSIRINENKVLSPFFTFIGEHTLAILTWHLLCFKLVSRALVGLYDLHVNHMSDFPVIEVYSSQGWWIAYLIIGCGIPLFLVLITLYAKRLFGKCYRS